MNILTIDVSPNGEASASRQVGAYLISKLKKADSKIVSHDLSKETIPHLSGEMIQAFFTPPEQRTAAGAKSLETSDKLIDELLATDALVITTPMWNFGPPSVLKSYIDHISRAGRTFSFGPEGLKGLVTGKKAYVVLSSGSIFSSGPFASMDALTVSLRSVLNFIGVTDVTFIRVEGTNDPTSKDNAIKNAIAQVDALKL